ncbi:zinc knuckle [Colletotrichum limetticola]|uniref:Zinc knuckle n=1 Tax=Colletotrichum limetticola TaxID=1209924 RepID=A0ABQ9PTC6_9PEZI|nr:zinc knuckle [Colletotrichum limetticola]
MGKVVEKAMSKRLTILSLEHRLVPYNQFGFARRSTTKALELILNRVYRCWNASPRMFATLMTIDMTGAFDHVDREVLLNWAANNRQNLSKERWSQGRHREVDIILNDGDEGISDATVVSCCYLAGRKLSQVGGSQGGGAGRPTSPSMM